MSYVYRRGLGQIQMQVATLKPGAGASPCGPLPSVRGREVDPSDYVCENGRWRRRRGGEPKADVREEGPSPFIAECEKALAQAGAPSYTTRTGRSEFKYLSRCVARRKAGDKMKKIIEDALDQGDARSKRTVDLEAECAARGVPPEYIADCVAARKAGVPLDDIIESMAAQGIGVEQPGLFGLPKIAIYGGVAGALVLFYLYRRRS